MPDPIQLFAKQRSIYPRRVSGKYRNLKWVSMIVLLAIYYVTPWIRWDRGPQAPNQAILIDIPHERGYFFGIEIWPQEVYYITGILILAAVGLFFITSILGRVWCGYACPQTVWTDLFIWVERFVQGDRNARMKLDQSPWTFEKIRKKSLTHLIWLCIGLVTGGAWVFYFNDAPTLADHIIHGDVPWSVGGWILGLTGSTYLMAGFAREQVCTYMCPYARFQSAMFDKDTLIISYDQERGEPRGKHKQGETWENRGHCIDCDSCVIVCPQGIDIRNGLQMECIACGLCVDACNNVMDKLDLPRGLIRYDTENACVARKEGKPAAPHILRPRTFYYAGILALVAGLMLYVLLTRSPIGINVLQERNPLFVTLSNGDIRNSYTITLINKTHEDRYYRLSISGVHDATVRVQAAQETSPDELLVLADSVAHFRIFIAVPKPKERRIPIEFRIEDNESHLKASKESIFISARE